MPITVPMIEEKVFKTKVRGYDPVEVDAMLDEICDEMLRQQEEIANLQARLAQASRNMAYPPVVPAPAAPAPEASEGAQKLMENAQRLYDDMVSQAKREAEEIVANARGEAEQLQLKPLEEERDRLQQTVEELREQARAYREQLLALMSQQREELDALKID